MDVVALSRAQFALTIMFHYLFPPLSIGLGAIMVMLEGLYLRTGDVVYEVATRFLTKVFAVNFAVGVASGIVMEFQFGTNWSTYSRFVGDVFGSALAAEGIFAFFLESGFLAVLVFGWDRVSKRMHFFATLMVFLGSTFSAVWIVIANSWQHTPAGFHLVGEGARMRAEIVDFWAMIFNPSSMHRLNHVLLGSFTQGAFFVMSICAWYVLWNRHQAFARRTFPIALGLGLASSWALVFSGHQQANMVAEYQPAKLAAFEGLFETSEG
ncbi:MAG: cytochrome ubiquinol oxidase subunit I, partial [Myxococcota bacterium]